MTNADQFIERRIVTGLIVSGEYLRQIAPIWDSQYLESSAARTIAKWCWEYFHEYHEAPNQAIQDIFTQKLRAGFPEEQAESIELILDSLSEDYARQQFNVDYLIDSTREYFTEQKLTQLAEEIQYHVDEGDLSEAEKTATEYANIPGANQAIIDLFERNAELPTRLRQAFAEREDPLIEFPGALGQFWNAELTRDAFIALMGPEKRGKTFWLMEIALRAARTGSNVAFFQAGDMSEKQQLRRMAVYLAGRSDRAEYCGTLYRPEIDCRMSQRNSCEREERETPWSPFVNEPGEAQSLKFPIDKEVLQSHADEWDEYRPCRNCDALDPVPWLLKEDVGKPLTWQDALTKIREFRMKHNGQLRLATYPNESLSVQEIKSLLDRWERQDQFVPDVIVIDYADILAPDPDISRQDHRHQQGKIWQRLRNLSQEKHCLVATATQAAASSYERELIRLSDFSEDKRKYAHVTAMYGLNQTPNEKAVGVMRINKLVVRDSDFNPNRPVTILQRLQMGRPFLRSYFEKYTPE